MKILIIDDDVPTCSLLKIILDLDHHRVSLANKVEADDIIALLERERPEFLILDYHLKGTKTLDYLKTIRTSAVWQHIAVLMISAIDYTTECLEAGANGFILKPFEWQDVTVMVNKIRSEVLP